MNVFLPVKQLQTFLICFILMTISVSTRAADSPLLIKNLGEGHCLVRVNTSQNYLLLPVEDASPDVRISMIVNNKEVKNFDVRLAIHKVDYFVPVDLFDFSGKTVVPFATPGGSGMGRTNEKLRPSCPGAKLLPGKLLNGRISEQELKKWVDGLGL